MGKSYKVLKHSPSYYNKQIAEHFGIELDDFNSLGQEMQENYKRRVLDSINITDFTESKKIDPSDFRISVYAAGMLLACMAQAIDKGPQALVRFVLFSTGGLLSFKIIKVIIKRVGINIEEKKMNELKQYLETTLKQSDEENDKKWRLI